MFWKRKMENKIIQLEEEIEQLKFYREIEEKRKIKNSSRQFIYGESYCRCITKRGYR